MKIQKVQLDRLRQSISNFEGEETDIGVLARAMSMLLEVLQEHSSTIKKLEDEIAHLKRSGRR